MVRAMNIIGDFAVTRKSDETPSRLDRIACSANLALAVVG
jgi:hypothetical protein